MGDIMGDSFDFADISNQIRRQLMNKVYEFNLMLVGKKAWGKSSLVKSLFQNQIKPEDSDSLHEYSELLEENGVELRVRCIETSNDGDYRVKEYMSYIDQQLEKYFIAQRRQSRWNIEDTRVHCCLFLIPPYGNLKLQRDDIECMKALHEKVNLVPIISGSDRFDDQQKTKFKENVLEDLRSHGINYFRFEFEIKEDEERHKCVKAEAEKFPFAIIAADEPTMEQPNKKPRWLRNTTGGLIDINDSKKCDFSALQQLLIRHCMLNLMDSTHMIHYVKYKRQLLEKTRREEGRNLRALGLEAHEIKRILYDLNPNSHKSSHLNFDKQRADMERELDVLRKRLQTLKATKVHSEVPA